MVRIFLSNMELNEGIRSRQKFIGILKEVFRKSIHLCSAFVPSLLSVWYMPVMALLFAALVLYSVSEILRMTGHPVPVVSSITAAAARKRDENKFVLGPVTLVSGIIASSILWQPLASSIGIYALAFGDGLASLSGKLFGKAHIPLTGGKTAEGSLTCFAAIFISCFAACISSGIENSSSVALIIASVGMIIELLPLKDFDNILIPVLLGGISQALLF